MIEFIIDGHELHHEVQTIAQVFYPNEHYHKVDKISDETITIVSILTQNVSRAKIYNKGIAVSKAEVPYDSKELQVSLREKKRVIKQSIYMALKELTGYNPHWGMLTGIRPAKTINELIDEGYCDQQIWEYLNSKYDVKKNKIELALEVAHSERKILGGNKESDISIYIGIPFCPTRCLYCSFTSYPLEQYANIVDSYLDALIKELKYIGEYAQNRSIKTVYIGGGTPTSLNEMQLERLLKEIKLLFKTEDMSEFTVEAGRPDTITEGKLDIMKRYGVNRISINPQTMNERTLISIGRKHSVNDIITVFNKAREVGHNHINMDLILGLPQEGTAEVENTMKEIANLSPDSITVHTLAVKRASKLKEEFANYSMTDGEEMEKMLEVSYEWAKRMGMKPYYLYRQKNMVGSYENVGYCKEGYEGIYNVEIMEEKQTILAAGAGATTKMVDFNTNRIDRVFNVKNVEEYMNRIDEMIQRKKDRGI